MPTDEATVRLLDRIARGPVGPKVAAFFDLDGTIVDGYTAGSIYSHRLRHGEIGPFEILRTLRRMRGPTMTEEQFEELVLDGIRGWAGRPEEEIAALGQRLFSGGPSGTVGDLFHDAHRILRAHRNAGHTVVIATSATQFQAAPFARELEVEHLLCTRLEVRDGVLTGGLAGRTLWGKGKLVAVQRFAAEDGIDPGECHAYANGDEDVDLLRAVGHHHAVNPQPELAIAAEASGWPVLRFDSGKAGRLDPLPVVRTATMFGTLMAAAGVGVVAGVLNRNRRTGVDTATSLFDSVAGPLTGISITVHGEHNAWAVRPAVFFLNHQSTMIDFLVTSRIIRSGYTAVAKAEVKQMPVVGPLFDLAGVTFLDRADHRRAVDGLRPAVEILKHGTSVVIAPEGTRSLTPRVGQFKKGGFHLAAQAGVPIVPIVIRNAGEVMWKNARTIRSGHVEAVVLPPISTTGWTKNDIDERVVTLRQRYIDTLDNWPGRDDPQRIGGTRHD
jgi:putative phosphoserine phosphatase/1-acylglycerol-3-phosphate O-acyltransferase